MCEQKTNVRRHTWGHSKAKPGEGEDEQGVYGSGYAEVRRTHLCFPLTLKMQTQ